MDFAFFLYVLGLQYLNPVVLARRHWDDGFDTMDYKLHQSRYYAALRMRRSPASTDSAHNSFSPPSQSSSYRARVASVPS